MACGYRADAGCNAGGGLVVRYGVQWIFAPLLFVYIRTADYSVPYMKGTIMEIIKEYLEYLDGNLIWIKKPWPISPAPC